MNPVSLNFLEPSMEIKYQKEIYQEKVKKMSRFMIFKSIFLLFFQIYLLSYRPFWWNYIVLVLSLIILIIILLLLKRNSRFLMFFLMLTYIGHTIFYVELMNIYHHKKAEIDRDENKLVLVIPFQILQSLLIFIKSRWMHCSLAYFCSLIYFFFRVIDTGNDQSYSFSTVIINFWVNWILYSFIAYDQEKNFKTVYSNIVESYEKVSYFKLILKNVIPSPVFIIDCKNSEVKFSNNSGLSIVFPFFFQERNCISFECFRNFIRRFGLLTESGALENSISQQEDLFLTLTNYYNDPNNKPIKPDVINENDFKSDFMIMTVCQSPKKIESSDLNILSFSPKNMPEKRYYELKIIKIFWEDSVCLLILFDDHTHIFQISELMSQDRYKDQLLASVSHDLRTPLNGLNGMLELSLAKTNDPVLKEHLHLAQKSAFFLNYLINDILDFSLMNFQKMRLGLEEVNLKQICEEMISLFEYQARQKEITVKLKCSYKMQLCIFSDPTRIKQILLNLLSNSLKFTERGFIEVILEDFTEKKETPLYKISVKDTGIGIKEKDFNKLYKLFGRLENQEKINKTGIGLGLTISKKISKLLCPIKEEGLEMMSEYGIGSTFYFYISNLRNREKNEISFENSEEKGILSEPHTSMPYFFFEENESMMNSTNSPKKLETNEHFLKKILVVDDDLMNLLIVEQYLHLFHIPSLRAINGLDAYKIIKDDIKQNKNEICMVLMDCNMPILDGFQASLKINNYIKKKGNAKIPILAVTANANAADILLCKNSGMNYFLGKPLKKSELKKVLEDVLLIKITEETIFSTNHANII